MIVLNDTSFIVGPISSFQDLMATSADEPSVNQNCFSPG